MPACHSKLLPSSHCQEEHGSTKYRFDLSYLPKKGWSVCGVAIESIDGEDRPVLMFKRATADQTTPSTEEFAVALKLAAENTRPKFEFVTITAGQPFEGRHYNLFSPSWLKDTAFGKTLFEADVEMKLLKLHEDER